MRTECQGIMETTSPTHIKHTSHLMKYEHAKNEGDENSVREFNHSVASQLINGSDSSSYERRMHRHHGDLACMHKNRHPEIRTYIELHERGGKSSTSQHVCFHPQIIVNFTKEWKSLIGGERIGSMKSMEARICMRPKHPGIS